MERLLGLRLVPSAGRVLTTSAEGRLSHLPKLWKGDLDRSGPSRGSRAKPSLSMESNPSSDERGDYTITSEKGG